MTEMIEQLWHRDPILLIVVLIIFLLGLRIAFALTGRITRAMNPRQALLEERKGRVRAADSPVGSGLTTDEEALLREMVAQLARFEQRMDNLETILMARSAPPLTTGRGQRT
jgi:hypothetical protein